MPANIMTTLPRWVQSFDPGYEQCRVCKVQRPKDDPFCAPPLTVEPERRHGPECDIAGQLVR